MSRSVVDDARVSESDWDKPHANTSDLDRMKHEARQQNDEPHSRP